MSPSATSDVWSSCSSAALRTFLSSHSCLPPVSSAAISRYARLAAPQRHLALLPGQRIPAAYQCFLSFGPCFRPRAPTLDCAALHCEQEGGMVTKVVPQLDGSHCGKGRACFRGVCRSVPAARRRQMPPRSGGWSEWRAASECGRWSGCSECKASGQRRLRVESRICGSPWPKNGGRFCRGAEKRGLSCGRCPSLKLSRKAQRRAAAASECREERPRESRQCFFRCTDRSSGFWRAFHLPDGVSCRRGRHTGRCVSGSCFLPLCSSKPHIFVSRSSDCKPPKGG